MLIYEHERTRELVTRLTLIGNLVRNLIIFGWILLLGGLIGGLCGLMLGLFSASVFAALLEWLAQMLVAQGEILAALKSRESSR